MGEVGGLTREASLPRISAFLALGIFLLYCTHMHLPWRDEYQTFLAATRPTSFEDFWTAVRYERTPPFHYILLRALWPMLDGVLDPRTYIRLVTLSFSFLSLYLLFFRFRLSLLTAVLIGSSVFFFREWGVISRTYVIGGALLLLSLDFRRRGKIVESRLLILASATTHLLFFGGAGALLGIEYFLLLRREGVRLFRRWDFWVSLVVGVFILIQQLPPPDSNFATDLVSPGPVKLASHTIRYFAVLLFPVERMWGTGWDWNYIPISPLFGVFALAYLFYLFRKNRGCLYQFFVTMIPVFFVYLFGYPPCVRHLGVFFVFFVYFWVLNRPALAAEGTAEPVAKASAERILARHEAVLFFGPALATLVWLAAWNPFEPKFDLSDSTRLTPFVATSPQTFTTHDFLVFPAAAEARRRVYDLSNGRWSGYPLFKRGFTPVALTDICAGRVPGVVLGTSDILVIKPGEVPEFDATFRACPGWTPIYKTERKILTDEQFAVFVYEKPVMTATATATRVGEEIR